MSGKSLPSALHICLEQVNTDHGYTLQTTKNHAEIDFRYFYKFLYTF